MATSEPFPSYPQKVRALLERCKAERTAWVLECLAAGESMGSERAMDGAVEISSDVSYCYVARGLDLRNAIAPYRDADVVAVDTETTGLDPHRDSVRLVQLAARGCTTLLVDLFEISDREALEPLAELLRSPVLKVGHNLKFDWKFLQRAGLPLRFPIADTMLASQILDAGRADRRHGLQVVAARYLEETVDKTQQKADWSVPQLSRSQLAYAARDAEVVLKLWPLLRDCLASANLVAVARLEFETLPAIAQMELEGVRLDCDRWWALSRDWERGKEEAAVVLQQQFAERYPVDLDSPGRVLKALQKLGVPITDTKAATLKPLSDRYPAVAALLQYRARAKALSAFGNTLPQHVCPETGRIHPQYFQIGASSGRLSCSRPNLQQVPRDRAVRSCFVAGPGRELVVADYSQIELRIAAELSGDRALLEAFQAGRDLHRQTAALVLQKPEAEVTPGDRQLAKALNFGLLYGMGARGLRGYARSDFGVEMAQQQAEAFRHRFFAVYGGLAAWQRDRREAFYDRQERTAYTLAGRRRLDCQRFAAFLNAPIQGTGADILKWALARLYVELEGTDVAIVGCVHDEILLSCDRDRASETEVILRRAMVEAGQEFLKRVPVEVVIFRGRSWGGDK